MEEYMNNLLIAQSGGPTVAINATLVGVVQAAQTSSKVNKIYGARNGIEGVLNENFIDLSELIKDTGDMELLCQTPAAALGSCRFKLDNLHNSEEQYETLIRIFRKYQIMYFIYIGGNDSMDTVHKLSEYCKRKKVTDIYIMGAPKTIDNDLEETDHSPGFGSAAKYIATTCAELERDTSVYSTNSVTIVEIMGRNAGWLTAASSLARLNGGKGPSLIYLCEREFDIERFIQDVKYKLKINTNVIVAVSEGIKDAEGRYISEQMQIGNSDVFGHVYIAGAGRVLENIIKDRIGCKVRSIELNLMQRSASHIASATDINESRMLGMKALQCVIEEITGQMVSIQRKNTSLYEIEIISVPIEKVANKEKKVPMQFINSIGNDVTTEMVEYLKPLIQGEVNISYQNGIPKHFILNER
jgi:6-phosphofructokinase 1